MGYIAEPAFALSKLLDVPFYGAHAYDLFRGWWLAFGESLRKLYDPNILKFFCKSFDWNGIELEKIKVIRRGLTAFLK